MHEKMSERPPQATEILRHIPAVSYFFLLVLILASAGWFFTSLRFSRLEMESRETHFVELAAKRLSADLLPAISDLKILSENPTLINYFEHPNEVARTELDASLLRWINAKTDYFELRYLDLNGQEISRVDRSSGPARVVPVEKHRNSAQRLYFIRTLSIGRGEVLASAFDLWRDKDKIRQPSQSTLRLCTPLFDLHGERRGVLTINYAGQRILQTLQSETSGSAGQIQLLNADGYWLKGPIPDDEWAFLYPEKKDRTFGRRYPRAWTTISAVESGTLYSPGGLFAFRSVSPLPANEDPVNKNPSKYPSSTSAADFSYPWKIVSVVPAAILDAQAKKLRTQLAAVDSLALILIFAVSWFTAHSRVRQGRALMAMKQQAELLNLTRDAIIVRDLNHTILSWSHGAEKMYGWTEDYAIGRNYLELLKPRSPIGWDQVFLTLLSKQLWSGEVVSARKDGSEVTTLNRLTLGKVARGVPAAILNIATDITDRKRAEIELESAKEAAEAASRAKSEFLAVMSHEIRTPMNGVIGMAGLLLDTPLNTEQREYAETVRHSADALLTIINDILDFSKIEAGKMSIEPIPCDLRNAVEEVAELMAGKAREKGLDLILRYSPDAPRRVIADPGRIRQILINLAGNAIKFTSKGHVYISVECEAVLEEKAQLRISVEDTGIGIPDDKLGTIFERFTQADASTTRRFGGTGLGLAISKQLTELMGGSMGVESRAGHESKFWITLPLTLDRSPEVDALPKSDLSGVRVLGVDDNPTNLFVLREQLNSWGMRNDMSSSAEDALCLLHAARAADDPYDIAVLDQQMPDMDGETLARTIKADPELRETALVMLTSMGMRGDAARMREAGFDAYLVKPARQAQLFETLGMVWAARAHTPSRELVTGHALFGTRAAHPMVPSIAGSSSSAACSAAVRGRILVVEDNSVNQKVATRLLEKMSYRADVAADGSEALRMIELLPYDVVLMDCQMPVMDGYEATREIRSREANGTHRVIIAMTANAMHGDRERCIAAGMDDYISKPIRAPELAALLDLYVRKLGPVKVAERADATT